MRMLRFSVAALAAMLALEGFAVQEATAGTPFPLFAPVYAQSRAYRKAVRYSMRHPFSLGSPVVVPAVPVATIPVKNVATGYYSPQGYFYRASYRSPVMSGAAPQEPMLIPPAEVVMPGEAVPVEPEIIPAPSPVVSPQL